MDMSNSSSLVQKNSALLANNWLVGGRQAAKQRAVPNDMLQQISSQMMTREQGSLEVDAAAKAREIRMDSFSKTEYSQSMEEMPNEILEYYLGVTKLFANSANRQEQNLLDFKDRIQGMDQTIQGYQDILDGKSVLPEGLEMEDVIQSMAKATQIREQFFKDGVEYLNQWGDYFVSSDNFDHLAQKVLGENKFAGKDVSDWKIDSSTSDIYAEIDRVLVETQGVTEELNRGVQQIYHILDQRDFGDKYKHYLESWRSERGSYFDQIEAKDVQQLMRDNLMSAPRKREDRLIFESPKTQKVRDSILTLQMISRAKRNPC